jgi:hypothetical protein
VNPNSLELVIALVGLPSCGLLAAIGWELLAERWSR